MDSGAEQHQSEAKHNLYRSVTQKQNSQATGL